MTRFILLIGLGILFPMLLLADPSPLGYPVAVSPSPSISMEQFLVMVFENVKAFGGLSWTLKIATIVLLLIGSMKVSALRPYWDKLGSLKAFAAPVLSLVAGILSLSVGGSITLSGVTAYLFAGAGAIILHELLDAIKKAPGIGPMYIIGIEFMQKFLKGKSA
jgi:hypothetical protein